MVGTPTRPQGRERPARSSAAHATPRERPATKHGHPTRRRASAEPPHAHQPRRQIPHRIRTAPSGLDKSRINKPSTTCAQPHDVTGVARRNGCSASRADLVLQAWSASVTDSGSGRGAAWTPPMLTAPAREPEPRASPAQQGCAEGQQTIGEGPSRVARALPLLCDRRDHRVGAVTTGVCISCAARSVTGQLRINLECRQRAVRAMTGWRCINPSVSKAAY